MLQRSFPTVSYAAGLLGTGSEVLGYDTPMSTDHNWEPRLMLFLDERDYTRNSVLIGEKLRRELPHAVHGYPTSFRVIHGDTFARAIAARIPDGTVRGPPPMVGAVDQFADATDVLSHVHFRTRLRAVYGMD